MSVDIEPLELNFRRPFTVEVSQTLTIKNTSSSPLAFKVKTTAPRQYCVRPNAGRIEPGRSFDVTVLLQAMKEDPAPDARCKDKFLVQSAPVTADKEFESIATVLDGVEKGQLQERKIRVNWLAAGGDGDQNTVPLAVATPSKQSALNGVADTPDVSRTYSSPSAGGTTSLPPPYTEDNASAKDDDAQDAKSTLSKATSAVTGAAQLTYEELKAKLSEAQGEIAQLRDSGLRQRNVKGAGSSEKSSQGQTTQALREQPAAGVSVQIVAILCLVSFLLAYFFF